MNDPNRYREYGANIKTLCVPFDLKGIDDFMNDKFEKETEVK